jgi:predicted aminopeptidase
MLTDFFARPGATAPGASRIVALAFACLLLGGCGTTYLLQAARGQYQVMSGRRPIDEVVADSRTSEELRSRLAAVRDMRAFASRELALPDNASYRTYVRLERPYVVWNVVAAPEFSVEPRRWCFPIVGCLAYRGYFGERRARTFAARLKREGYDVFVGGVAAYSTLGRLADPVLSSMLSYGEHELAAVLFHELAHQILYVPGDTTFNEAFAVAVEQVGLARWLASRGAREALAHVHARREHQAQVLALFSARRAELARLYREPLPGEAMRDRKRAVFAALEADLSALEARTGVKSGYSRWFESGINNAHLASVATYFDCVPAFERLLEEKGGDLPRFYAAVKALGSPKAAVERKRFCPRSG